MRSIANKQPNQKLGKRSKQTFSQRQTDGQKAHGKLCSTLLIIREMQIKTTMRKSEGPPSKTLQTINAGEGVEKKESSCTVGGKVNWYKHYGEQHGISF